MRRITIAATALTLGIGAALGIAACGGDETTTITQPAAGDTTATETGTTTGTETTTQGPQDCGEGQVFSQGSGTCVDVRDGDNPCPQGEVPMADEPVCVPRN